MSRRLGEDREEKIVCGIGNTMKVAEYFKRKNRSSKCLSKTRMNGLVVRG